MDSEARFNIDRLLEEAVWARRLALHLVQDSQTADDLVQETWSRALERPPSSDGDRASPRGWLARVMQNVAHSWRRDAGLRKSHEERASRSEVWSDDELAERVRLQRRLAEAVLELDEPYRSAITLRYFEALSLREVAEQQGISYESARQRVSRALAMLRARLDREHGGDRAAWSVLFVGVAKKSAPIGVAGSVVSGGLLVSIQSKLAAACAVVVLSALVWEAARIWSAEPSNDSLASTAKPSLAADANRVETANVTAPKREIVVSASIASASTKAIDRDHDLHGQVVDPSGAPVAGAKVEVYRSDRDSDTLNDVYTRTLIASQLTDASGNFAIALAIGRSFDVDASAANFAVERMTGCFAGSLVTVHLHRPGSLHGFIVRKSNGEPVSGARLRLSASSVGRPSFWIAPIEQRSDALGHYRFDGLGASNFLLSIEASADAPIAQQWKMIQVADGEGVSFDVAVVVDDAPKAIRGSVVDAATKSPIADAQVSGSFGSVRTDSNGEFVVEKVATAHGLALSSRAVGYGRKERGFPQTAPIPERVDFELDAARRARGRVVDPQLQPIEGAMVVADANQSTGAGSTSFDRHSTRTDARGMFELDDLDPAMKHALIVKKDDFGTTAFFFPSSETSNDTTDFGDIALAPMAVVRGTLLDDRQRPVADRCVLLSGCNDDRWRFAMDARGAGSDERDVLLLTSTLERAAFTDDLGRFSFADLPPGHFNLDVRVRPGEVPAFWECAGSGSRLVVAAGQRIDDLRVLLPSSLAIAGRVLDEHGRPVAKAWVSAQSSDGMSASSAPADTDADGRFEVRVLAKGTYTLRVGRSEANRDASPRVEFASRFVEGVEAGTRDVEIQLHAVAFIRGRVLDSSGNPIHRALVSIARHGDFAGDSDWTEADGRFSVPVPSGDIFGVRVEASGRFGEMSNAGGKSGPIELKDVAPSDEELFVRFKP